eukprot:TRINITY_DN61253_c0_g1_i1.p1 TRINITY_DN61253_c0_g1~~TRINITY_DN61253_c0_g1_i1.p1  ORF type:complete len:313 (+),score=26.39 TRINITY_DN61253_c0_g1_i1:150-1088(+)
MESNAAANALSFCDSVQLNIPLKINQVAKEFPVNPKVIANIAALRKLNPCWKYEILLDKNNKSVDYLAQHFDRAVVDAYRKLKAGPAKGDFLRYCMLFIEGGLYVDLDTWLPHDILKEKLVLPTDTLILFYDRNNNLRQDVLLATPRHEFLNLVIEECVKRINRRVPDIWLATGPHLVTDVFLMATSQQSLNFPSFYLYKSQWRTSPEWRLDVLLKHQVFMGGRVLDENDWGVALRAPGMEDGDQIPPGEEHYGGGIFGTPGLYVEGWVLQGWIDYMSIPLGLLFACICWWLGRRYCVRNKATGGNSAPKKR